MNSPSRFTPAPPLMIQWAGQTRVDTANAPTCVCGESGPLDEVTGTCRACWRLEMALLRFMVDRAAEHPPGIIDRHWITPNPAAVARPRDSVTSAEPPPDGDPCEAPNCKRQRVTYTHRYCSFHDSINAALTRTSAYQSTDELVAQRSAREAPRLTATSGPGVGVDVVLAPPDPLKVVCPTCRQNPGWNCVNLGDRMQRHGFHASRRRAVMP